MRDAGRVYSVGLVICTKGHHAMELRFETALSASAHSADGADMRALNMGIKVWFPRNQRQQVALM